MFGIWRETLQELWKWDVVWFLCDVGFQLLNSSGVSLSQMFSVAGASGLQPGQFITRLLSSCCLQDAVWHCLTEISICVDGSICCSKLWVYCLSLLVPSNMCKPPMSCALMRSHTIIGSRLLKCVLITSRVVTLLFSPEDTTSMISKRSLKFWFARPQDMFPPWPSSS